MFRLAKTASLRMQFRQRFISRAAIAGTGNIVGICFAPNYISKQLELFVIKINFPGSLALNLISKMEELIWHSTKTLLPCDFIKHFVAREQTLS